MASGVPAGPPRDVAGAPLAGRAHIRARALFLGNRLDLRSLERAEALATSPLTVEAGERGCAVLFRFGTIVLFDVTPVEEAATLEALKAFVQEPVEVPEAEQIEILVGDGVDERVTPDGAIAARNTSVERLQVIATVLAKSTVLSYYESRIARVFDRIEPLASQIRSGFAKPVARRSLLREIGEVLLVQTRMVGRVEVTEKSEITWERPDLDRLYERLSAEYELRERDLALTRKLELISETSRTLLELVQHRQTLRVEWYIVLLIVFEVLFSLYLHFTGR
jgi:uncharacterized Rmd1/YagE family protein